MKENDRNSQQRQANTKEEKKRATNSDLWAHIQIVNTPRDKQILIWSKRKSVIGYEEEQTI